MRIRKEPLTIVNPVHIRTKLHPPNKTVERLLESEKPWEEATLNWFSVLQDQGKLRMWYECYDREGWPTADDTSFCYAESEDGINWTRPNLGLFEYKGSKKNNILFRQIGTAQSRSRVHGSCVSSTLMRRPSPDTNVFLRDSFRESAIDRITWPACRRPMVCTGRVWNNPSVRCSQTVSTRPHGIHSVAIEA